MTIFHPFRHIIAYRLEGLHREIRPDLFSSNQAAT